MQVEERVRMLLAEMTLAEKLGQMQQIHGGAEEHKALVRRGLVGSVLNLFPPEDPQPARIVNEFQAVAVKESRLGIPLIIGRDVIHGFRTIMPIPLGQAASFDMALVEAGSAVAAREAAACGLNWTFAPMVDIARDPRWGRIAEGGGEDPLLSARLGAAMVRGFQGSDLAAAERIAACAKHYVGYGAAEGGRDYNTTNIPDGLLRNVYLPSFKACVDAGAATLMSAFNDLNGVPATGNAFTLRQILKQEWGFDGFVVSDWASVEEMIAHGFCADKREAALIAIAAGVDMEMVTTCYAENAQALLDDGLLTMAQIDDAVSRILRIKLRLGLFDNPYVDEGRMSVLLNADHLQTARQLAAKSCVLLKNDGTLPLRAEMKKLAVIGPLADASADQLGCWVFDGRPEDSITPLRALREALAGRCEVCFAPGLPDARSMDESAFTDAAALAEACDAVVLFLGEDAQMSGEAHSRAFIELPGAQAALIARLAALGKPLSAVILTGRPLALTNILDQVNALLIAWHPGTMGGPALADLLLGVESPSGKLPASFPRTVGQAPVYYNHTNTGRPPAPGKRAVPMGTPLNPEAFCSSYIDVDPRPLFPFGYGQSYASFTYTDQALSTATLRPGDTLTAAVTLTNTGAIAAEEVVQLYTRDLVGSVTRPVKELKDFTRIRLAPGASQRVTFTLHTNQLAFYNAEMQLVVEPGAFQVMIGGNSEEVLIAGFAVVE